MKKQNNYFTFGCGQLHENMYVKIFGTPSKAREKMFEMYGQKWSMQYDEKQWNNPKEGFYKGNTLAEVWGWTELG